MGVSQTVFVVIIIWLTLAIPLAVITAMLLQRIERSKTPELPAIQSQYIDTLIDDVLDTQSGADDWLEHKKMIIAEVFANGEAWCNANGDLVEKNDPSVAAHITFNVIRAAMMKFYAAGILEMQQEGKK